MRPLHPISALAGILLVAAAQAIAADAPTKPLRYGWKPGESYVYSVRVELEGENVVETMQGNSTYTVKSADADGFTLIHRGRLIPQVRTKEGRPDPLATFPRLHFSPFSGYGIGLPGLFDQAELKIDALGNVQTTTGSSHLPMLGHLSRLVLEPLPAEPKGTWEVAHAATIQETEEDRFPGPGPRFGPFGPRFGSAPTKTYQAQGRTVYTLGEPSGDTVPIAKTYELKTQEMVNGRPRLELAGKGTITFDVKAGVPRALEFTATSTENTANTTVRVPIKVSYKLLEGAEREKALAPTSTAARVPRASSTSTSTSTVPKDGKTITTVVKTTDDGRTVTTETTTTTVEDGKTTTTTDVQSRPSSSASTGSVPSPAPAARRNPASDADVDHVLAGLESPDDARRRSAANRLASLGPNERRAEVAGALTDLLRDGDHFTRQAAARALGTWGTKQSVPALIKAIDDGNFAVRWAAIEALGNLKDERAAGPIAAHLKADAIKAAPALRAMGAAAEAAVLEVVKEGPDWMIRAEACRILEAIGTTKSVPDLERIAREDSGPLRLAAQQALKAIAARP